MKSWKNLFVKSDEKEPQKNEKASENLSFPVSGNTSASVQPSQSYSPHPVNDPIVNEVLQVYENGLDSINMPGYDFYEFYQAITSIGDSNEQTYKMAYQMAKTLDKTITSQKLMNDAEFYISKINEVYSQYVSQGQQKLNGLQEKKSGEKIKLTGEIDQAAMRVAKLRSELQQLESEITQKRNVLAKIDEGFYPQEKSIREKLNANDVARKTSIDKLNMIKEGILKFVKG
jgi:hypothetical protein